MTYSEFTTNSTVIYSRINKAAQLSPREPRDALYQLKIDMLSYCSTNAHIPLYRPKEYIQQLLKCHALFG